MSVLVIGVSVMSITKSLGHSRYSVTVCRKDDWIRKSNKRSEYLEASACLEDL